MFTQRIDCSQVYTSVKDFELDILKNNLDELREMKEVLVLNFYFYFS